MTNKYTGLVQSTISFLKNSNFTLSKNEQQEDFLRRVMTRLQTGMLEGVKDIPVDLVPTLYIITTIFYGEFPEYLEAIKQEIAKVDSNLVKTLSITQTERDQIEYDSLTASVRLSLLREFNAILTAKPEETCSQKARLEFQGDLERRQLVIQDNAATFQSINKIRMTDNSYNIMAIDTHKSKKPKQSDDIVERLKSSMSSYVRLGKNDK